ncbi:hypothetical protein HN747_00965 [archaeon]|jgi:hypothetical protein|nr:hypothetical protein [archaeon]
MGNWATRVIEEVKREAERDKMRNPEPSYISDAVASYAASSSDLPESVRIMNSGITLYNRDETMKNFKGISLSRIRRVNIIHAAIVDNNEGRLKGRGLYLSVSMGAGELRGSKMSGSGYNCLVDSRDIEWPVFIRGEGRAREYLEKAGVGDIKFAESPESIEALKAKMTYICSGPNSGIFI